MADDWTQANVREIQYELEELRREIRGRSGEENGGGVKGEVKRLHRGMEVLERSVATMDKGLEIKLIRVNVWLLSLSIAVAILTALVLLLIYTLVVR
jgi:hypothetical protein